MSKYNLTKEAAGDLYRIWEYTVDTWSEKQADKYYEMLISAFKKLAQNPEKLGKSYEMIHAGLKGFLIGRHVIFYLVQETADVLIVRILHSSMDFARHLKQ